MEDRTASLRCFLVLYFLRNVVGRELNKCRGEKNEARSTTSKK